MDGTTVLRSDIGLDTLDRLDRPASLRYSAVGLRCLRCPVDARTQRITSSFLVTKRARRAWRDGRNRHVLGER